MAAASAPSGRVGESVAAVITNLGLTPAPSKIQLRKRPVYQDGDGDRLVLVCVGDTEEFEYLASASTLTKRLVLIRRPVMIAIAFRSGGTVADNPDLRAYRDAIWSAVNLLTLAANGLPECNEVYPAGKPIFDPISTPGIDWSTIQITVETHEER